MSSAKSNDVKGSVMVVGGGISGIQSALDLADAGFKIYLVEKDLSIGGVMTQLDKTFPTNDCSMCILAPKLVTTGRHENIELLTNTEVLGVKGNPGHFFVDVRMQPRFVDLDKCNGCGDCVLHCPVTMPSIFDEGLGDRTAIFQPFPQAIPNAFAISKEVGKSPCVLECPAGLNVQGFVALVADERWAEAYELIRQTIPLPGSMGRICYHPCEDGCNRSEIDESVSICALRRAVAEYVLKNPKVLSEYRELVRQKSLEKAINPDHKPRSGEGKKVAVIGSGPAGLTAASDLALLGYEVVVFEAEQCAGGMLRYGVPSYRLPNDVLEQEINVLCEESGFEIKTNICLGKDISFEGLRKQGFDAFFVAVGAQKGRLIGLEQCSEDGPCVHDGVSFLHKVNSEEFSSGEFSNRKVVVIGGGNVAMDAARCAIRLGASVEVLYRRSEHEMPAHDEEIKAAREEGVVFRFLSNPVGYSEQNPSCIRCVEMQLGEPDESGRRSVSEVEDSEFLLKADDIILAVGQSLNSTGLGVLKQKNDGFLKSNPTSLQSNIEDIFVGGDAVSGPASAVDAIAAGHRAAESIDRFLRSIDLFEDRDPGFESVGIPWWASREQKDRQKERVLPAKKRVSDFSEVNKGLEFDQAVVEARRCLNCAGCCECEQCVLYCGLNAIDHEMLAVEKTLEVGSVVLSPGFDEYEPPFGDSLGYGLYPNVLTSIEFERMLSASGPYGGHVKRPSDGKTPKKIAWLQCIGSRDESCGHPYCSSVCCMYATKEAVIAKEHVEGVQTHIYQIDMRSFGKGFERYYNRAKDEYGVLYRRCRIPRVDMDKKSKDLLIHFEHESGELDSERYDMVILSVGLQPCESLGSLAAAVEVNLNEYNFLRTDIFEQTLTTREGVFAAGAAVEPRDIPESVTQASAAAADAAGIVGAARGSEVSEKVYPNERLLDELPRIGVFVCKCGINIAGTVDVARVVEYASGLPGVVYADESTFTCSTDSQDAMRDKIVEMNLNRVVIASCTPRTHEPLFQETLRQAGLNPHLFEMANIRDQNSWVHKNNPELATLKALDSVRMAVAKASDLFAVSHLRVPVTKHALVIGGGISGMSAALSLGDQGYEVSLVEREPVLGGHMREIYLGVRGEDPVHHLEQVVGLVDSHPNIRVYASSEVIELSGYVGNFESKIQVNGRKSPVVVNHGVVIVASGAVPYEPSEYGFSRSEKVVTQTEFESQIYEEDESILNLDEVVMIQCVGSRNDKHPYCSRICCSQAIKNAIAFKELNSDASVYVLYRDIRTFGFREDMLYAKARKMGVLFVRFKDDAEPVVKVHKDGSLEVEADELLLGKKIVFHPDRVVLSCGVVPADNSSLSKLLKAPLDEDGFFSEAHVKLRPVDFAVDGVFVCGLVHSPRFVEESIVQAKAAAARAATILSKEFLETKGNIASIKNRSCSGCKLCLEVCPYDAISFDEEEGVAVVNSILCQGCGACAAVCPNGANQQNTFTKRQIISMIDACLE